MSVQANLVPDLITNRINYTNEFNLIDGYFRPSVFDEAGEQNEGKILNDANYENDMNSKVNWRLIGGKSSKSCQLDGKGNQPPSSTFDFKFITCDKVTAHFYRNFLTTQAGEDIQVDKNTSPEVAYEVKGFTRSHKKSDFSDPDEYRFGGSGITFTPVSAVYKASI